MGEWLEFEEGNDPWERSKRAMCNMWDEWEGMEDFRGEIVHPQTWPEDLDYKDKNVLVIGSGATTATLVPAIAGG